jgi:four helix bundle protein
MEAFEKLDVWKRSCRLAVTLYQQLRDSREWGFRDQITRAALSIPSNIAEGYERNSRKEYLQFLRVAKGSCGEVRTQLYIGQRAGLLESDLCEELIRESGEISKMLGGLISTLSK